uniref:Uncharacterized protein n=1 Tax=Candidatus Kentrum sp. FW TaxID=2126338 RepID=A0A450U3R5_9GAMM|nr:MAG: hypothetical protein BECKFW1821C_GA0114237_11417 [Candidatus Kentron sp. FW]
MGSSEKILSTEDTEKHGKYANFSVYSVISVVMIFTRSGPEQHGGLWERRGAERHGGRSLQEGIAEISTTCRERPPCRSASSCSGSHIWSAARKRGKTVRF